MHFDEQLAKQDFKREVQKHMAEAHGELISRDDIDVIMLVPRCHCHAGVDFNPSTETGRCPKCGQEARIE